MNSDQFRNEPEKDIEVTELKSQHEKERQIRLETLKRRKAQIRRAKEMTLMEQQERRRKLQERKLRTTETDSKVKSSLVDSKMQCQTTETQSMILEQPPRSISGHTLFSEQLDCMSYAESAAQFRLEALQLHGICEELGNKDLHEFDLSPTGGLRFERSRISPQVAESQAFDNDSIDSLESVNEAKDIEYKKRAAGGLLFSNTASNQFVDTRLEDESYKSQDVPFIWNTVSRSQVSAVCPQVVLRTISKPGTEIVHLEEPIMKKRGGGSNMSVVSASSRGSNNTEPKPRWGGGNETEVQRQRRISTERRKEYAKAVKEQQSLDRAETKKQQMGRQQEMNKKHPENRIPVASQSFQRPQMIPISAIQTHSSFSNTNPISQSQNKPSGQKPSNPAFESQTRFIPSAFAGKEILNYTLQEKEIMAALNQLNAALEHKELRVPHQQPITKKVNSNISIQANTPINLKKTPTFVTKPEFSAPQENSGPNSANVTASQVRPKTPIRQGLPAIGNRNRLKSNPGKTNFNQQSGGTLKVHNAHLLFD